ncbi:MAG TPA: glycosyltransferase family 4 protein [Dehalococcoidia bacterium]|jgi:glycosyltransferase involved in cell wall biosynthesis|nr:glycosyltransferase family 4 protein [Dehalococcoidia bacterium]
MKIIYPYPAYWPYMRRGAERCIHDITNYLARRGHEVHIVTSKPGRARVAYDGDVRVEYLKQLSHPLSYKYTPLLRLYTFGAQATAHMVRGNYDVAHLWSYSAILAAPFLKRWMDVPYLFHMILRTHHWPGRVDRFLFQQLLTHANKVAALTPGGADEVLQTYGVPAISLSPPVDMDAFRPGAPTDIERPRVLFTGDLGDPRKGGPLLLRAWDEIHRRCPEAVLVLAGPFGLGFDFGFDVYTLERLDLIRSPLARDAVEIPGAGQLADLPDQYSRASVTVLPSVDEAFGMVVTESLASGTPVVCSSYGGPGEIITNPEVGVTVPLKTHADLVSERAARQLADAVLQGIELSRQQGIVERCRAWAEPWSLARVGAETERVLMEIAETRRSRTGAVA